MLKIYLLVIVLGLVGGSVYGAYYYYKDSQERIRILTENTAKLETAKQLQDGRGRAQDTDAEPPAPRSPKRHSLLRSHGGHVSGVQEAV